MVIYFNYLWYFYLYKFAKLFSMEPELRIFLIIVSFVNSLLYFAVYAYFDTIIGFIGTSISGGSQSFLKILVLVIAGFCIGLIPMLILSPGMRRNRIDVKSLILVGIIPFILLVLSPGPVIDFIATRIFSGNENIKELLFYLLSRQSLWAVWLGFAVGTSARISFRKRHPRHEVNYAAVKDSVIEEEEKQDEGHIASIQDQAIEEEQDEGNRKL